MSKMNIGMYDLLIRLRSLLQDMEVGNGNKIRRFGQDNWGQPAFPKQRWHTFGNPETNPVIKKNRINHSNDQPEGYVPIRKDEKKLGIPIGSGFGGIAPVPPQNNTALAYLYFLQAGGTAVVGGADVPLNVADPIQNMGFSAPGAVVQQAGIYSVYYGVNVVANQATATQIAVAVNGVPLAKSVIPILVGQSGEFSGKVLLALNENDVVTIRNAVGGGSITLAGSPGVGAQLDIVLL